MDSRTHTRIQFVITGLDLGGAEVLLRDTVVRLQQHNYTIQVVSLTDLGPIGRDMQKRGIDVCAIGGGSKFDVRMLYRLYRVVRTFRPDILHSHLFHANLVGRVVGSICRVPVIMSTIHNINFGGALRERLLRYTDGMSTQTVAISDRVHAAMLEKKVVPENKLTTIDNGIDTETFKLDADKTKKELRVALHLPLDTTIYLSVGRLMEQKGYAHLLAAAAKVVEKEANVLFVILGEGELRPELEKMVLEKGLKLHVQFRGNQSNVGEYMQASDVFVMPSLWEGLPIALLEAMAYELPVVASSVGSVPDVVDGDSGLLVPAADSAHLADALIGVQSMDRTAMGEKGRARVVRNFSIETTVTKYERLYSELCKK